MGRGRKAGRHLRGGPRTDEVDEEEGGGKATVLDRATRSRHLSRWRLLTRARWQ